MTMIAGMTASATALATANAVRGAGASAGAKPGDPGFVGPVAGVRPNGPAAPTGPPAGQPLPVVRSDDPGDAAKVEHALEILDATRGGAAVAKALRMDRVPIQVLNDKQFQTKFPGAGGVYDQKSNTMYLPRGGFGQPELLATVLAHEGTHHIDDATDIPWFVGVYRDIGGAIGGAAAAVVHLHNPMTSFLDGFDARQHVTEVNAYTAQASVSKELGIREYPYDLGENQDGSVASRATIAERVKDESLYRRSTAQRAMLGGVGVGMAGVVPGMFASMAIAHFKPESFLGRHPYALAGAAALLGGAALGADLLSYRRDIGKDVGSDGYS